MDSVAGVDTHAPVVDTSYVTSPVTRTSSSAPLVQAVKETSKQDDQSSAKRRSLNSVEGVVKELNDNVKVFNTSLTFSVDKDTGETVVKVVDSSSGKVVRQIPGEEMLKIAARIKDLLGVLFDQTK
jgi:flagellar protein FlaG